jgi:membrane protein implicated in regulation of membrane protease activity
MTNGPTGRAVGPRLRWLLIALLVAAALLTGNAVYLAAITFLEWVTARPLENYFYQYMFLAHLALRLVVVVPFALFVLFHLRAARRRRNRLALRTGSSSPQSAPTICFAISAGASWT